ncbi:MAG: DNA nickase, partial [Leptolyngbya sp. SIO4C1]|nr:DNA nickase [Leptolyngbya sp. SIO4C1]
MVATQETSLNAIAVKLADMLALQELLISNEQTLLPACSSDEKIASTLREINAEDQENLQTIRAAISELGVTASPQQKTQEMASKVKAMMSSDQLVLHYFFMQHQ